MEKCIKGTICRAESKDFYVLPAGAEEQIRCSLRGKFKKDFHLKKNKLFQTDITVVGDFVEFDFNEDGTGVIYNIEERRNYLSRKAIKLRGASYRGERLEQIVASNIDNLFVISSVAKPPFNNKVIDRLIVTAESSKINTVIVLNKIDLDDEKIAQKWVSLYSSVGYTIITTSKITGEGIPEVRKLITGKKNLFWGQSGVSKSSLLNKLFPGINLNTGEISSSTEKGKHTTVTSLMLKMENETYIIDTPGIREIDPYGIKKEDLGHYFVEFLGYINKCKFNTCTHYHEPGCAVIKAVDEGNISFERYDSYLRILETIEEDINF
ncbi:MAG: ribosome small subunit-dependent GTPase A [Ignavibacteriaceae bacterium]